MTDKLARSALGRWLAWSSAAVVAFTVIGVVDVGPAHAAAGADLSISQGTEPRTTPGKTVVDVNLVNSGPSTANSVDVVALIATKSTTLTAFASNGACQTLPPPPGYNYAMNCQYGSLASLGEDDYTITYTGDWGSKFESVLLAGESSPGDPNTLNNTSIINSWLGPAADLKSAQHATTGSAGRATVTATATNAGPDDAGPVVIVSELRGDHLKPVHTTPGPGGSCVHLSPSPGYSRAFSCTINSLASGASFSVTSKLRGKPGSKVKSAVGTSAETPAEPDNSNNRTVIHPKLGKKN